MSDLTVPCPATGITVTVTAPITHLCPYRDEVDEGEITVRWTPTGYTLELHALREHLHRHARSRISHEDLTAAVLADLTSRHGITDVSVHTRWSTAGFNVEVAGAVPGERVQPEGA